MSRLAIAAALEALEAGDNRLVEEILLGALEDLDESPGLRRLKCPRCRVTFDWPGALERHLLVVHGEAEAA